MTNGRTWRKLICCCVLIICSAIISSCDDQSSAYPTGGGPGGGDPNSSPGSSDTSNATSGAGFGSPSDAAALGNAVYTTNGTAHIDTDGDPAYAGSDGTWNLNTSGTVNGQPVNSGEYAYVVVNESAMQEYGITTGDWALVTNTATGQETWARVEDVDGWSGTNEISVAAANSVGIQVQSNSNTVGNPSISIQYYKSK